MLFSGKILRSAGLMMMFTTLSKVTGQLRQMLALAFFGATFLHDSFVSANRIPNSLRELLAEGALSAAFVPIFTKVLVIEGKERAFNYANNIINISVLFNLLIITLGILFSSDFMTFYHENQEYQPLAADLLIYLLPFVMIISLNAIMMGILNSLEQYITPSIGPFASNIIFISVLIVSYNLLEDQNKIFSLVFSTLAGGLAYVSVQIPAIIKSGFRYQFVISFKDKYVREFLYLFLPAVLSMGVPKLIGIMSNKFATDIKGANTSLYYSFIILQLPISIFITGISVISLTNLSKLYEERKIEEFTSFFLNGYKFVCFFTLPSLIGLMILSTEIAQFIYYDIITLFTNNVNITLQGIEGIGSCLFYYSFGIIPMGLTIISFRVFQSIKKMNIPLYSSVITVISFIILASILKNETLKYSGIALAFSISSYINFFILFVFIIKEIQIYSWYKLFAGLSKIIVASFSMGWVLILIKKLDIFVSIDNMFRTPLFIITGLSLYTGILFILREEEVLSISKKFKEKYSGRK